MDGLGEKLNALLSDPGSMSQILSLVQSISASPPETQEQPKPSPPPAPSLPLAGNDELMRMLVTLMDKAGRQSQSQEALLQALRPFVRPERQKRLDRAMQLARLSYLAGSALSGFERGRE